jgi:hypothetical protein
MKGQTNNPNGRPKGSTNVITREVRAALKALISDEIGKLPTLLAELPAEKKIDVLLKLMPYVLPKVETIRATAGESLMESMKM